MIGGTTMGNQYDLYECEDKDVHEPCGYVRGSMGCEAAHQQIDAGVLQALLDELNGLHREVGTARAEFNRVSQNLEDALQRRDVANRAFRDYLAQFEESSSSVFT